MRPDIKLRRSFPRKVIGTTASLTFLALQGCSDRTPDDAPPATEEAAPLKGDEAIPTFWRPVEADNTLPPTPQAIRSKIVAFDVEQLRPPLNKRIVLSLPDGREIAAVVSDYEEVGKDQFIWRGEIEGEVDGQVTLSVVNQKLVGDIITENGSMYSIRSVTKGVALVEELDPSPVPPGS